MHLHQPIKPDLRRAWQALGSAQSGRHPRPWKNVCIYSASCPAGQRQRVMNRHWLLQPPELLIANGATTQRA